ncbi:PREDICTED: uncharacterized protein K02A2.6-like, partial [Gekko japonicus]|uniref:Gypsy retrotransposon integrase-like protein 1 n=1 Tax=Gekko japonicus TaxID=146911 RepID=A0ABM1KTE9_GEKJA
AAHTAKDSVLSRVLNWVWRGWPVGSVEPEFGPYKSRQNELSISKGCVLWGNRVVVPDKLRTRVLESLHEGHPGMVHTKALARGYVWWPGLDKEIEEWVRGCPKCQQVRPDPPQATPQGWESSGKPWARLHIDFAGPLQGQMFLIVVDAMSKWLEVVHMKSTTSLAVIHALRRLFATHGLPDVIVSDNGPQFVSEEFRLFLTSNGIRQMTSAPFHPASNGQAERMVRTAKEALGKMRRLTTRLNRMHPDLTLNPEVQPIKLKARCIPFALKPKTEEELDHLAAQGILEPVPHALWETPIVTPIKPNGDVCICADYKCTINKALQDHAYPVPVISHVLVTLSGVKILGKLDLAQAYQQLLVDDATAEAQTIVTHWRAFWVQRLQFGVTVAPGIFQT